MKGKLFVLFLALTIIAIMTYFVPKSLHRQLNLQNATCQIFCTGTTLVHANVGFGKIVSCNGDELAKTLGQCSGVDGVSFTFVATQFDVDNLVLQLDLQVHSVQTLNALTIICGYSPQIPGGIVVDGNKTNVQIAFDGNVMTVGSPLILGSY